MAKAKDKDTKGGGTIALNKRSRFEYHIDQRYEAGIALQGWELKALRAGRINFGDGYAVVKNNEIFLVGTSIPPLISASTHVIAEDRRTRKLLLHRKESDQLGGAVERKGYTWCPPRCTGKATRSRSRSASPAANRNTTSATPRNNVTGRSKSSAPCAHTIAPSEPERRLVGKSPRPPP